MGIRAAGCRAEVTQSGNMTDSIQSEMGTNNNNNNNNNGIKLWK
jgi:hypothetical protein